MIKRIKNWFCNKPKDEPKDEPKKKEKQLLVLISQRHNVKIDCYKERQFSLGFEAILEKVDKISFKLLYNIKSKEIQISNLTEYFYKNKKLTSDYINDLYDMDGKIIKLHTILQNSLAQPENIKVIKKIRQEY